MTFDLNKILKNSAVILLFKLDQTSNVMSNVKQIYIMMIHYELIYYELKLVTSLEIIHVLNLSHSKELY